MEERPHTVPNISLFCGVLPKRFHQLLEKFFLRMPLGFYGKKPRVYIIGKKRECANTKRNFQIGERKGRRRK